MKVDTALDLPVDKVSSLLENHEIFWQNNLYIFKRVLRNFAPF